MPSVKGKDLEQEKRDLQAAAAKQMQDAMLAEQQRKWDEGNAALERRQARQDAADAEATAARQKFEQQQRDEVAKRDREFADRRKQVNNNVEAAQLLLGYVGSDRFHELPEAEQTAITRRMRVLAVRSMLDEAKAEQEAHERSLGRRW